MADKKITALTALTGATTDSTDPLVIVDLDVNETKKITLAELYKGVPAGTVGAPAIAPQGDQNTGIYFPTADTMAFVEGGVEAVRIDSSGNVGIGTNAPTTRLHVESTAYPRMRVKRDGGFGFTDVIHQFGDSTYFGLTSPTGDYSIFLGDATSAVAIGASRSVPLIFGTNNLERMQIDGTGNVGIGTATPATFGKLAVAGNTVPTVDNTYSLGTSVYKWSNVFATTFTENGFNLVSQTDLGTNANEIPLNQYLGALAYKNTVGLQATANVAPTVASASSIQPQAPIVFVSGTTTIDTIVVPLEFIGGGQITLIPTGLWSTGTSGNIAIATTGVVSKALIMTYDAATTKWYPSY